MGLPHLARRTCSEILVANSTLSEGIWGGVRSNAKYKNERASKMGSIFKAWPLKHKALELYQLGEYRQLWPLRLLVISTRFFYSL